MARVTFLVTANIQGKIQSLPSLYTALLKLKSAIEGPCILVDAGLAWSDAEWICSATENRAPYLVLDAMGYDLAFADGLADDTLKKLGDQVQVYLAHPTEVAEVEANGETIKLQPDASCTEPAIADGLLNIDLPPTGKVREILIDDGLIRETKLVDVQPHVLPDPTITATVEFVRSEAQYYAKKRIGRR